ncbi:hypothetical protein C8Q79DRAFT_106872 [Trametes meyenii]|nr:hypothetical protein C8Q79DRAFT_106872 [Trametes meyenii]
MSLNASARCRAPRKLRMCGIALSRPHPVPHSRPSASMHGQPVCAWLRVRVRTSIHDLPHPSILSPPPMPIGHCSASQLIHPRAKILPVHPPSRTRAPRTGPPSSSLSANSNIRGLELVLSHPPVINVRKSPVHHRRRTPSERSINPASIHMPPASTRPARPPAKPLEHFALSSRPADRISCAASLSGESAHGVCTQPAPDLRSEATPRP